MRISDRAYTGWGILAFAGLSLPLAGCNSPSAAPKGLQIACQMQGAAVFEPSCTVEQARDKAGKILILHHADGGFRRLAVKQDGHGVSAADGAEPASVSITGNHEIEVTIGGDRYRLPATLKATPGVKP